MSDLNKAMLIGRLGNDPELRYLDSGNCVATLSIATTAKWKDKEGNVNERTEWHRVTVWGKLAEICGEYLTKGRQVYIEGEIRYEKYTGQDGVEKYATKIIANTMQMLGSNPNREQGEGGEQGPQEPRQPQRSQQGGQRQGSYSRQQGAGTQGGGQQQRMDEPFPDDDIPF